MLFPGCRLYKDGDLSCFLSSATLLYISFCFPTFEYIEFGSYTYEVVWLEGLGRNVLILLGYGFFRNRFSVWVLHPVFFPERLQGCPATLHLVHAWATLSRPSLCSDTCRYFLLSLFCSPVRYSPGWFFRCPSLGPFCGLCENRRPHCFQMRLVLQAASCVLVISYRKKTWRPKVLTKDKKYTCKESLLGSQDCRRNG